MSDELTQQKLLWWYGFWGIQDVWEM